MTVVAIIQARMNSTRLPNKVLMPVLGRPLLSWMLDRVTLCKNLDEIVVATTTLAEDDAIEKLVRESGFSVYRGSENDVLDRYFQASNTLEKSPAAIVRLTADCPLLDPIIVDSLISKYQDLEVDFLSNSEPLPSSWPDGMDLSVMSFDALREAWLNAEKPSEREHVTFYFWSNPKLFRCQRIEHEPDLAHYRLTLDYPEDYDLIKTVIEHFEANKKGTTRSVSMPDIIQFLDNNQEIFKLNRMYERGLGWVPSFQRDQKHSAAVHWDR